VQRVGGPHPFARHGQACPAHASQNTSASFIVTPSLTGHTYPDFVSTNVIEYDNIVLDIRTLLLSYSKEITEGRKEGRKEREKCGYEKKCKGDTLLNIYE
jgi:hypothetical protein